MDKRKWTDSEIEDLVSPVQCYIFLYDTSNKDFKDWEKKAVYKCLHGHTGRAIKGQI